MDPERLVILDTLTRANVPVPNATRLVNEMFPSFGDVISSRPLGIRSGLQYYRRLTAADGRINFQPAQATRIINASLWIQDTIRVGLVPIAGVYDNNMGIEAKVRYETREVKRASRPDGTLFKTFPKNVDKDYEDWVANMNNHLNGFVGQNEVSLSYMVRDEDAAGTANFNFAAAGFSSYDDMAIACCEIDAGAACVADSQEVYTQLMPRIIGTSAAEWLPTNHKVTRDGRAVWRNIHGHYGHVESKTIKLSRAMNMIKQIHYKSEQAKPFDKVIGELQAVWTLYFDAGSPQNDRTKFATLTSIVRSAPDLAPVYNTMSLIADPTELDYLNALSQCGRVIAQGKNSSRAHVKQISAVKEDRKGKGNPYKGKHHKERRGKEPKDWYGHDGFVPGHIFKAWTQEQRDNHKANSGKKKGGGKSQYKTQEQFAHQLSALNSRVIATTASMHAAAAAAPPVTLPPAPATTQIAPGNVMGGRTAAAAAAQARSGTGIDHNGNQITWQMSGVVSTRNNRQAASLHTDAMIGNTFTPYITAKCELDSHADTWCLGPNFVELNRTFQNASVAGFNGTVMEDSIPISTGGTLVLLLLEKMSSWLSTKDFSLVTNLATPYATPIRLDTVVSRSETILLNLNKHLECIGMTGRYCTLTSRVRLVALSVCLLRRNNSTPVVIWRVREKTHGIPRMYS